MRKTIILYYRVVIAHAIAFNLQSLEYNITIIVNTLTI